MERQALPEQQKAGNTRRQATCSKRNREDTQLEGSPAFTGMLPGGHQGPPTALTGPPLGAQGCGSWRWVALGSSIEQLGAGVQGPPRASVLRHQRSFRSAAGKASPQDTVSAVFYFFASVQALSLFSDTTHMTPDSPVSSAHSFTVLCSQHTVQLPVSPSPERLSVPLGSSPKRGITFCPMFWMCHLSGVTRCVAFALALFAGGSSMP